MEKKAKFRISASSHRPLVDVCRPNDENSVISNDKFAVQVNNLSGWLILDNSMSSKAEKGDVVIRVNSFFLKVFEKTFLISANGVILPVKKNSRQHSVRIIKLTCETRD